MRTLTLLSVLIASYLANPVVHHENSLVRRASNGKESDVDVNTDVDVDVDVDVDEVQHRRGRHYRGLLDSLSLGRLLDYILYIVGLGGYYDVEDNRELLGLLVLNGDISEDQADEVEGVDILGLLGSGHRRGILGRLINLDAAALSDQDAADKGREMSKNNKDAVAAAVTLLDDNDKGVMVEGNDVDADVDVDVEIED